MRIRRRPPPIPAPTSSDPAAVETGLAGAGTGGKVGKGESIMETGGLHPSLEARGKGGRPWGGDSDVSCRLRQPEGSEHQGSWTAGGSDGSCFVKLQVDRHKGKAEADGDFDTKEESDDQKQAAASAGAAQLAVVSHKAWNHSASGTGLHNSSATAATATNGIGAAALISAPVIANCNSSELRGASRKRRNIAWSNNISRSARSPSLSSLLVKAGTSKGGGVTNYMHGTGDHQLVKDENKINGEEQQQQQVVHGRGNSAGNNKINGAKRRRSPAVLMEGSRCSRVNGRGWRCCQQTLVGYSLCEHHLGKGRLRSVSSVKCKKAGGGKQPPNQRVSALLQQHDQQPRRLVTMAPLDDNDDDEDYEVEAKPFVGKKRGKRIGTVKARSISSLLCQTSSGVISHAGVVLQLQASSEPPRLYYQQPQLIKKE